MLTDAERSLVRRPVVVEPVETVRDQLERMAEGRRRVLSYLLPREWRMAEPKRGPESGTARPSPGQIKPNPASVPRPVGKDEMGRGLKS